MGPQYPVTGDASLESALQPATAPNTDSATMESAAPGSASVKQGGQAASATPRQVCHGTAQPLATLSHIADPTMSTHTHYIAGVGPGL